MTVFAIVLGAAVRPDGTPSPTLDLRCAHAAMLHREGHADLLCTTGGTGAHGPPEGEVAAHRLRALGVPDAAIRIERTSRTTHQNIVNALTLAPDGAHILLVSNRWHLPRAALIARLMGRRVATSGPRATAPPLGTARSILREALAAPLSAARAIRSARRSGR